MRVLDRYKILQVSTGKPADLAQAWSTPLTAEGDTAALDSKAKSEFSITAERAWLLLALLLLHWLICMDSAFAYTVGSKPGDKETCFTSVEQKVSTRISTGQILDWSFTYGTKPGIFIATELAW